MGACHGLELPPLERALAACAPVGCHSMHSTLQNMAPEQLHTLAWLLSILERQLALEHCPPSTFNVLDHKRTIEVDACTTHTGVGEMQLKNSR